MASPAGTGSPESPNSHESHRVSPGLTRLASLGLTVSPPIRGETVRLEPTRDCPTRPQHLVTTPAVAAICHRCRGIVLTGLAEGIRTTVDLTPLNSAGEIHALLAGLWTYTLLKSGLVHRDAGRIAGTSLHGKGPVLGDHRCRYTSPPQHVDKSLPEMRPKEIPSWMEECA